MKKVEIDINLIEKLKHISWLSCISKDIEFQNLYIQNKDIVPYIIKSGKNIKPIGVESILSYNEYLKSLKSLKWKNTILEWKNILSMYLNEKNQREYQQWNSVVKIGQEYFDNDVLPRIDLNMILSEDRDIVLMNLKSNIIGIFLESAYREYKREGFFTNIILPVYIAGHMPCGWKGDLPNYLIEVYPKQWENELLDANLMVY